MAPSGIVENVNQETIKFCWKTNMKNGRELIVDKKDTYSPVADMWNRIPCSTIDDTPLCPRQIKILARGRLMWNKLQKNNVGSVLWRARDAINFILYTM